MTLTMHACWIQPRRTALAGQGHALETVRRELATARRAAAGLPGVERAVRSLATRRAVLQRLADSERDATDLLRDVQALGEGPDLHVTGFKPGAPVRRESLTEWSVAVELEGSYAGLLRFLRDVADYPRLVVVTGLRVRASDRGRPDVSLVASCRLSTFGPAQPSADVAPTVGSTGTGDHPVTRSSPPSAGGARKDEPR
jgi:Tfp pilus assembly protein PilO